MAELADTAPEGDRYLTAAEVIVDLGPSVYSAFVHLAVVDETLACVGIDIRAFEERVLEDGTIEIEPDEDWAPLTARAIRDLRFDAVVREAIADHRGILERALSRFSAEFGAAADVVIERDLQPEMRELELLHEGRRRKRGRPAALSNQVLVGLVARTYLDHIRAGGRTPVVAVRDALDGHPELPGAGPTGNVTIGQARAAVRRAREQGLLGQRQSH